MGLYETGYIFYGCPITTKMDKVTEKLNNMSDDEKNAKNIMSIGMKDNYLESTDAVFLVVPRTTIKSPCQPDANDMSNGYVKMSELESGWNIKRQDITPTQEEKELFTRYINVLVRDDKKDEMNNKIGYYITVFQSSTYDNDIFMRKLIPIDMTK